MRFEKVSKETWEKCLKEILEGAPEDVLERAFEAYNDIKLPRRATKGSAGYDFYAPTDIVLMPGDTALIPTGVKVDLSGYDSSSNTTHVLEIFPRSSIGIRYHTTLDNTVGIIDADYYNNETNEGMIYIQMTNHGTFEGCPLKQVPDLRSGRQRMEIDFDSPETQARILQIPTGKAFAQGIITEAFIVDDDEPATEDDRTGGIGSTTNSES